MVFKVQEHWVTYTEKVDQMVEEALRSNIKHSLKKLSRAINGDSKTSPNPLFKVLIALRQTSPQTTPKVPATPFNPIRSCDSAPAPYLFLLRHTHIIQPLIVLLPHLS